MAKAILMMDMPDKCFHCPMSDQMDTALERWYCQMKSKEIEDMDSKPDWCPLIKLPDRNPDRQVLFSGKSFTMEDLNDAFKLGEDTGWNAFIDYLEGKENG